MNPAQVRQYIFDFAGSNMYLMTEQQQALVIDPHVSQEALQMLHENQVRKVTVLLTHEHYDHISGLPWLKSQFDCRVFCHEETNISLQSGKNSRPVIIGARLMQKYSREALSRLLRSLPNGFQCSADVTFQDIYAFSWCGHSVRLVPARGHSRGSICIEIDDNLLFSGDSWIPGIPVITGFPGGSRQEYEQFTLPYLKSIPGHVMIFAGHGERFFKKDSEPLFP